MSADAGMLCRANGNACMSSNQCCSMICTNGMCTPPNVCQGIGGVCSSNTDCCAGTTCNIPAGQQAGTCAASTCVAQGQSCTSGGQGCCANLTCLDQNFLPCGELGSCTCRIGIQ